MDKEKIKKIINLAINGEPGEQKNAQRILLNLGIDQKDYKNFVSKKTEDKNYVGFVTYKDKDESTIIKQLYFKITNAEQINFYQINPRKIAIRFETKKERESFRINSKTIIELYRKEKKRFLEAFIQANCLFGITDFEPQENEKESPMTDILDIIDMAKTIKTAIMDNLLED